MNQMKSESSEGTLIKLLELPLVRVFSIPTFTGPIKASDWTDNIWNGRLQVLSKPGTNSDSEKNLIILLLDTEGKEFARGSYPGSNSGKPSIEPTMDSSRFFSMKLVDPSSGSAAIVGIGFDDRGDAFDFLTCLQDWKSKSFSETSNISKKDSSSSSIPLDFSLSEGQSITLPTSIVNSSSENSNSQNK